MATIKDLAKYIDYEFSSGCYTGDDYKVFKRNTSTSCALYASKIIGNS